MVLPQLDIALCMHEALAGGEMSGSEGGAGNGETGAGLQMEEAGVVPEEEPLIRPTPLRLEGLEPEDEEDEEDVLLVETAGGVK